MGLTCKYCGGYRPAHGESWDGKGCTCAMVPLRKIVELVRHLRNDLESMKLSPVPIAYLWHAKTVDEIILELTGADKCIDAYIEKVDGKWEFTKLAKKILELD